MFEKTERNEITLDHVQIGQDEVTLLVHKLAKTKSLATHKPVKIKSLWPHTS